MEINTFSTMLATCIVCISLSLLFLAACKLLDLPRLLLFWSAALGSYGIGLLLIFFRGLVPLITSPLVVNSFLIGCYALTWWGVSVYRERTPRLKTMLAMIMVFLGIIYHAAYITPSLPVRVVALRVAIICFLAGILASMIYKKGRLSTVERVVVAAFILDGVMRLSIVTLQLLHINDPSPLFDNRVVSVSTLFSMIGLTTVGVSLTLMTLENNVLRLKDALAESRRLSEQNQKNELRLQAVLEISQYNAPDIQSLLDFALQKVIDITESRYGYIYHYFEERREFELNSWSKDVMPDCKVMEPQSVYQLDKTGIWGEVVRQRQPVMVNDFETSHPLKKGYPQGHVHLTRFLSVPVFDNDRKIVAVVGIANKAAPYTETDQLQLSLMMDGVWKIVRRLELELELAAASRQWQTTFDSVSDGICVLDQQHRILMSNNAMCRLFNTDREQLKGRHCWEIVHGTDHPLEGCPVIRMQQTGHHESLELDLGDKTYEVIADPVFGDNGELIGAVHTVRDITTYKLAQQAVRNANIELEKRVVQRTSELTAKTAELERMNKVFVGRELRMRDLKAELEKLEGRQR
jgi:PAS domain S-box-containing protein